MNEQIIELANKANEGVGYTYKLEDAKQLHELMENFAELIVKECASICELQKYQYTLTPAKAKVAESTSIFCGTMIKKHFGIK